MLDFGDLYEGEVKEDVLHVIQILSVPCYDCRLGYCQNPKQNRGLIWRGNPKAKMAIVSIMPGSQEMITGKPLTGGSGKECDKWFKAIGLDTNKDMLVTNVVQCKPPDIVKKGGEVGQRTPEYDELAACFSTRCLRVLKAMPNLEMIITLGWDAAACFLGDDAKEASHMGHWYTTTILPGKLVYCLPHPAGLLRDKGNEEKKWKVAKCLKRFKRQYLDGGDKMMNLAKDPHNIAK